jgi:hypothetical protein
VLYFTFGIYRIEGQDRRPNPCLGTAPPGARIALLIIQYFSGRERHRLSSGGKLLPTAGIAQRHDGPVASRTAKERVGAKMRLSDVDGQITYDLEEFCEDYGHPRGQLFTFEVTCGVLTYIYMQESPVL